MNVVDINALGKQSELCTPHSLYLALGREPLERQENYCELFKRHVDGVLLENIQIRQTKGWRWAVIDLKRM